MFEKIEKMMIEQKLHFASPKLSIAAASSILSGDSWANGD